MEGIAEPDHSLSLALQGAADQCGKPAKCRDTRRRFAGELTATFEYPARGEITELRAVGHRLYAAGAARELDFGGGVTVSGNAAFIAQLDTHGSARWMRVITVEESPGVSPGVNALAADSSGITALTLAAQFPLLLDGELISPGFGIDPLQSVGMTFAPRGGLRWVTGPYLHPTAMAFDRRGNLFIAAGSSLTKLDRRGEPTWTVPSAEPLSPTSLMQPTDASTDREGSLLLIARYSGPFAIAGEPLAIQAASGFGVVLAKYGRDGTPLWHRSLPGAEGFSDVTADSMGNVVAFGRSLWPLDLGTGLLDAGGRQLLLAKYAPSGEPLFTKAWLAPTWQGGERVEIDPWNNIVLGAFVDSTVDLGGGPLTPNGVGVSGEGELAFVVAKLDACGAHLWSRLVDDGSGDVVGGLSSLSLAIDASGATWASTSFRGVVEAAGTRIEATSPLGSDILLLRFSR